MAFWNEIILSGESLSASRTTPLEQLSAGTKGILRLIESVQFAACAINPHAGRGSGRQPGSYRRYIVEDAMRKAADAVPSVGSTWQGEGLLEIHRPGGSDDVVQESTLAGAATA